MKPEMDKIDKPAMKLRTALLALLRAGLWEKAVDDLSCFPLSAGEWEGTYLLSRRQTVTGLAFQGLQHLPDGMLPPEPLLVRWMAETDAIERMNRKTDQALGELYTLFRSKGFNPVLQKGQGAAQFYEKPLLRECGDIDLYFNNSRTYALAATYIRLNKVTVRKRPDKSLYYVWNGIGVEHHARLFDLHNPFLRHYLDRLEDEKGYEHLYLPTQPGVRLTVPSPFLNLLMLDFHILKHALGWGVGLRQLCDMARACHTLHEAVDAAEMEKACLKLGLERWNPLLHAALTKSLGLPASSLPYGAVATDAGPLLDIVWRGGNFGCQLTGRNSARQPAWKRKLRTAHAFGRQLRFACQYAPKEAFWMVGGLLRGQL